MAETTYKSPGVYSSEIDLTGPTTSQPTGIPAGVIGTSLESRAFVPLTVGDWTSFKRIFGDSDGSKFGPLAVYQFLKNARALTYCRVLGIGDGKKRSASDGTVTNAGYVVGEKLVQSNGLVGSSKFNVATTHGVAGRTYFLGAFMSESLGSTYLSEAGIQHGVTSSMILRGVLMAPSGVLLTLSSCMGPSSQPSNTLAPKGHVQGVDFQGGTTGSIDLGNKGQFVMLINGLKNDPSSGIQNVLTATMDDADDSSHFSHVFNTDPLLFEEKGHLLYAHYDISPAQAVVTGTGIINPIRTFPHGISTNDSGIENSIYLITGSADRNTFSTTVPNYESFRERFTNAKAPFIISQKYGAKQWNLFRVHALDDGDHTNGSIKISIANIRPSNSSVNKYGTFDLYVRDIRDDDINGLPVGSTALAVKESWLGLTLDPTSDKFIGRVIGDMNAFFDFDQDLDSQKLILQGNYPVKSDYIRVELSDDLKNGKIPDDALPLGFRGIDHLVTSGSNLMAEVKSDGDNAGSISAYVPVTSGGYAMTSIHKQTVQPPLQFRQNLKPAANSTQANSAFYWGVNFNRVKSITDVNASSLFDTTILSFNKFFPSYGKANMDFSVGNNPGVADSNGIILDADRFNRNLFTLENVRVKTGSAAISRRAEPNPQAWASASYVRQGNITANETDKTRAFKVDDLKESGNRTFAQYSFILQGGFNGSNIFDSDKYNMTGPAVRREMVDSTNQGGTSGPTVAAYRKALDIMGTKADVEINLLSIPGIRHPSVTDYAITTVENRFDAMLIMDIEEKDDTNTYITSSGEFANVTYTVADLKDRNLDTSFAAAYFPDVNVTDPVTLSNVQCPPSVAVLGAYALNDSVGYAWFAPAGLNRAVFPSDVTSVQGGPLVVDNLDNLYDADINPIKDNSSGNICVWGQKTLLRGASALDRVNVRRLLISIRRRVRDVARRIIFEPNRQETLDKFNAMVAPIMQSIQERSGVDRYKVVIDATTTTQADIENNTIRGKIFIQPTRTAEFVALDFVLANAGSDAFDSA